MPQKTVKKATKKAIKQAARQTGLSFAGVVDSVSLYFERNITLTLFY